jgi:hypothetical protein
LSNFRQKYSWKVLVLDGLTQHAALPPPSELVRIDLMKIAMSASELVWYAVRADQHRRLAWRQGRAPSPQRAVLDFLLPDAADAADTAADAAA